MPAGSMTATGAEFSLEATAQPRANPKAMLIQNRGLRAKFAQELPDPTAGGAGGGASPSAEGSPASSTPVAGQRTRDTRTAK